MTVKIPTMKEVPERLFRAELILAEVVRERDSMRRALQMWTIALVVAIIGATGTMVAGGLAAAVAYGELRQTSASNAATLQDLRVDVRALSAHD